MYFYTIFFTAGGVPDYDAKCEEIMIPGDYNGEGNPMCDDWTRQHCANWCSQALERTISGNEDVGYFGPPG